VRERDMRSPSANPARGVGAALIALVPVLMHALAREADRGLGLLLRAEVEPDGVLAEVGRAMGADIAGAATRVALWTIAGLSVWLALAGWRRRREGTAWAESLAAEAGVLAVLLLRPAITILALLSVEAHGVYPYGFTLPVALTQDWGIAQDTAVLAALVALRLPAPRFPAPRAGAVFAVAFLAYACLVPDGAWRWEGHPGNEPKYLRQAVALGHGLTFDAEGVSAAMEALPTRPLSESLAVAARTLGRESWALALALGRGEVGREAIRATRITRQTVRGKEGGVFYVLAPGPSLMLAPALRADRALNLASGRTGRVALSVLEWCALSALLVMALFLLVRDATGRPGLAAALAFGFALVPPYLLLPVLPGDGGCPGDGAGLPDAGASARGPEAPPLALRPPPGDASLAAPEVPPGVARARGHGPLRGLAVVTPRSSIRAGTRGEAPSRGPCRRARGVRRGCGFLGTRPEGVPRNDEAGMALLPRRGRADPR
jgi:hypothetical protein